MNIMKSVRDLTKAERTRWVVSLFLIVASSAIFKERDLLTIAASALGATALIFVGKGDAIGQLITIIFACVYAIISFRFRYYGEMITYLGMTAPTAFLAMKEWLKNPYSEREVRVGKMTKGKWFLLVISAVLVTVIMWKVLEFFKTENLLFSTISVTTSFFASMLTVFRSPYYAIFYALNDVVLIVLWVLASAVNINYAPMILCFLIFLINDLCGFINWKRAETLQQL